MTQSIGIAALPFVMVVSVVVLIIGVGIAGTGLVESIVSGGDYNSKQALYAAEAGAHDAFMRVVKNKNCNQGGVPTCASYTLTVGEDGVATVLVTGTNPKTLTSVGKVRFRKRKIEVTVSWDANDKATYSSWKEVSVVATE